MVVLAWSLAAALALLELYAVASHRRSLESLAKPVATISVGAAAIATGLLDRPWGVVVLVGLALGVVGDVLLLDDDPNRFLGGLTSFLGGHLAYAVAFLLAGVRLGPWVALPAVVLLGCLALTRALLPAVWRDGGAALTIPVAAYLGVIAVMALLAGATGRPLVALGGALFVVSDTLLARDRFLRDEPGSHLPVMVTYLLAQAGIVGGMALV